MITTMNCDAVGHSRMTTIHQLQHTLCLTIFHGAFGKVADYTLKEGGWVLKYICDSVTAKRVYKAINHLLCLTCPKLLSYVIHSSTVYINPSTSLILYFHL